MKNLIFAFIACAVFAACNSSATSAGDDSTAIKNNSDSTIPKDTVYPRTDTGVVNLQEKDSTGVK
ncbi:MAG TPA: hypothetical protein VFV68_13710 [Agriterribacter sp.]|nr:hypothetical protein [Agriterribacter sp.]